MNNIPPTSGSAMRRIINRQPVQHNYHGLDGKKKYNPRIFGDLD